MVQTHVLFIDDSGTKEYAVDKNQYNIRGRGNSRYFVFCGILVSMKSSGIFSNEIIQAKLKHFRDDTVEIKSNWLRFPSEQKARYLDPYEMTTESLTEFTEEYYDIINRCDHKIIASVIDKLQMQEHYPNPFYPPAVAYETLLLRVQQELSKSDEVAIIIDDTTGKTPKGNDYKKNLQRQHLNLKKYGSKLWKGATFPSLSTQKFVNSQISHLVQVADVCAYNVHRQFQDHGQEWESDEIKSLPMYKYFNRINGKFRKSYNGQVQGYGICKMPEKAKKKWRVVERE